MQREREKQRRGDGGGGGAYLAFALVTRNTLCLSLTRFSFLLVYIINGVTVTNAYEVNQRTAEEEARLDRSDDRSFINLSNSPLSLPQECPFI